MSDICEVCSHFNRDYSYCKLNKIGGDYLSKNPKDKCCERFSRRAVTKMNKVFESPSILASYLVYSVEVFDGCGTSIRWKSTILGDRIFVLKSRAISATIAELSKEVYD